MQIHEKNRNKFCMKIFNIINNVKAFCCKYTEWLKYQIVMLYVKVPCLGDDFFLAPGSKAQKTYF